MRDFFFFDFHIVLTVKIFPSGAGDIILTENLLMQDHLERCFLLVLAEVYNTMSSTGKEMKEAITEIYNMTTELSWHTERIVL